jgi:hypothetical protein
VILNLQAEQIWKFRQAFPEEEYYVPPEEIIATEISRESHGHINLLHLKTGYKADCYLVGHDPLHAWALKNRRSLDFQSETIWLAPPEYVILRKLQYYQEGCSEKHLNDIQNMIRIYGENIDFMLLKKKINQLKLKDQWNLIKIGK